jgi:hypothetical protein
MGILEYDADDLVEAIKEWTPGPAFSEARCADSLRRHLNTRFAPRVVAREHRVGRGRADLFISFKDALGFGANVAIELKFGLTTMNEYHRLIGQLADYVHHGLEVVVVLCGPTSAELSKQVTTRLDTLCSERVFFKRHVVVKPVGPRTPDGRFLPAGAA